MALAALGQLEEGRGCNDEAMIIAERTGERWFDAEISRVAGEMELLSPGRDPAKAQAYFERALEIARAQQARSWELRAATSLARLWREQGRRAEALDLLAPIYGWFTEGFDTRDLKEAKAMLDALAS
jgi:predicted ATPase